MYRKIDEVFTLAWKGEQVTLQVEANEGCQGCFFACKAAGCTGKDTTVPYQTGNCFADARGDKHSVIFVKLLKKE